MFIVRRVRLFWWRDVEACVKEARKKRVEVRWLERGESIRRCERTWGRKELCSTRSIKMLDTTLNLPCVNGTHFVGWACRRRTNLCGILLMIIAFKF